MELDEIDIKILRELLKNARLSYRAIADRVGVAIGTVISRIKRMEEDDIIIGYSAMLNHEKLGYELTVITEITVSKGKLVEVEKEVANIPNVCCVYDITGLTDAIVIAKFKSRRELSDFTKRLLRLPYIERTNTHVVLTTIKEDLRIL